jgi:hypothetical protein
LLFSGPHTGLPIQKAIPYVDNGIAFYVSILTTHSFIVFVALYRSEMSKTLGANLLKQRREYHCFANHDTQTDTINKHNFWEF